MRSRNVLDGLFARHGTCNAILAKYTDVLHVSGGDEYTSVLEYINLSQHYFAHAVLERGVIKVTV